MIYTVTLNPSIDYIVRLDSLVNGITNRTVSEEYYFGGKGINVSLVLAELNLESTAFGFLAGFTGEAIEKGIRNDLIATDFITLDHGISRINVKIKAGEETEINGQGPDIDESALEQLLQKVDRLVDGDTIVLAGSIPDTMPRDTYERILQRTEGKDIRIIVDATKKLLVNSLKHRPFLIKPNRQELSELFDVPVETEDDIEKYARELQKMGARNVMISLGGEGAVLIDEFGMKHKAGVLKEKVINTVGSGVIADLLARESDFFSIGANDLTGYTMAADRGNSEVSYLYSTYQPGVLRMIRRIIKCGAKEGIIPGIVCLDVSGDSHI